MNKEEKEIMLKETYNYLKNTDFDKVKCQSDIYLDYIMLYEENKELKEELDKYKNIVEEIKQIIYREMKNMGYAINDSCLMFMLNKIEKLENGDNNE